MQYFSDQQKFISHLDDLNGSNGPEAQRRAAIANELLMTGIQAIVNDVEVQYKGQTYNARQIAWSKFKGMVAENPSYFGGRMAANVGTAGVLSLPFYKGGPLGLVASVTFGTSLQTTASLGAGIRAIENGMTNSIDVIVNAAYGTQ
jgi:hypothetical protein